MTDKTPTFKNKYKHTSKEEAEDFLETLETMCANTTNQIDVFIETGNLAPEVKRALSSSSKWTWANFHEGDLVRKRILTEFVLVYDSLWKKPQDRPRRQKRRRKRR